ncbi:T9SS type A sorting domain-containing protein [bacterium]|nr:T9SS type A sorting domain-containing protein [bacterium]
MDYTKHLELVGRWQGASHVRDVKVHDGILYVTDQQDGLFAIDWSNPTAPVTLDSFDPGWVNKFDVAEDRAYLCALDNLYIVDISDPSALSLVAAVPTDNALDCVVYSDLWTTIAYVCNGEYGFQTINVNLPDQPDYGCGFSYASMSFQDAVIDGDALWFAVGEGGVFKFDISESLLYCPHGIGSTNTPGFAYGLNRGENSAVFVADGDYPYGFAAVSSGDPPHFMNSLPTDGTAYDIEPIGTLAYVADGDAGLKVVDITRYWEDPTVIEEIETFDSARELWLEGEYLLVADDGGGILIYRVLDIEPAFEAAIPVIHGSWGTQYEDGLVYSTPVGYMLSIFDYSDPAAPVQLAEWINPTILYLTDFRVRDGICYGLGEYATRDERDSWVFHIVDCTDPANPLARGHVHLGGSMLDLALVGTHAFVACGEGLRVMDVSDLDAPSLLTTLTISGGTVSCIAAGNVLYLGTPTGEIVAVDVSVPSAPQLLQTLPVSSSGACWDLAIAGDHLYSPTYVWQGESNFHVLDIGTPGAATVLSSTTITAPTQYLVCDGEFAYLADVDGGLTLLDVRDPSAPRELLTLETGFATPSGITMTPTRVLVDTGYYGSSLLPFRRQCLANTAADDPPQAAIDRFAMRSSPNPFNPATVLTFDLPRAATATLAIYDVAGRQLRTLFAGNLGEGSHSIPWDGRADTGSRLPSGIYLARLTAEGRSEAIQLVLVK